MDNARDEPLIVQLWFGLEKHFGWDRVRVVFASSTAAAPPDGALSDRLSDYLNVLQKRRFYFFFYVIFLWEIFHLFEIKKYHQHTLLKWIPKRKKCYQKLKKRNFIGVIFCQIVGECLRCLWVYPRAVPASPITVFGYNNTWSAVKIGSLCMCVCVYWWGQRGLPACVGVFIYLFILFFSGGGSVILLPAGFGFCVPVCVYACICVCTDMCFSWRPMPGKLILRSCVAGALLPFEMGHTAPCNQ